MEATAQKLSVTRTIRGSRQRVFRAWTEPELMLRWFVEADWEMSLCEIDLREGGTTGSRARSAAGSKWAVFGSYLEVRPPDRLVYTWIWEHDTGSFGDPRATRRSRWSSARAARRRRSFSRTTASTACGPARITPRVGRPAWTASNGS